MFRVILQVIGIFELYNYYKKFKDQQEDESKKNNPEKGERNDK